MLDLVVEAAGHPAKQVSDDGHRRGDVGRGAELVEGEVVAAARRSRRAWS